jgi:hypothetical protein
MPEDSQSAEALTEGEHLDPNIFAGFVGCQEGPVQAGRLHGDKNATSVNKKQPFEDFCNKTYV